MPAKIYLVTSDNRSFLVDIKVPMMSPVLTTLMEFKGVDLSGSNYEEGKEERVLVNRVNGNMLALVIQWAEHHKDEPNGEEDILVAQHSPISQWDKDFIGKLKLDEIMELILVSVFLEIQRLKDLTCRSVAAMIHGKSTEELRQLFFSTD